VLVVDDEPGIRKLLADILSDEGFTVATVPSGEDALELVGRELFDLVLLDVALPGMDGLETLARLREVGCRAPVVAISGHASAEQAVAAVRAGAVDFLEKPLGMERVLVTVRNTLAQGRLLVQLEQEREQHLPRLTGTSVAVEELRRQLLRAAETDSRVLITGPNGAGKEVVARLLHHHSPRSQGPMVTVNCAAIPAELIESELFGHVRGAFTGAVEGRRGKFELADGGTLFLDEIGDMSLLTQAKVLRVLEDSRFTRVGGSHSLQVDVRVVAATNKDLAAEIAAGGFRRDLFYRLNVIHLQVPPLAERTEDIPLLVEEFADEFAQRFRIAPRRFSGAALQALQAYPWPGNIRELRNLVERVSIMIKETNISQRHLGLPMVGAPPAGSAERLTLREARAIFEREHVREVVSRCDGNISRAARVLGLERSHLYRKLRALGLAPVDRSGREG
jgi:two-component system nitrogen regulation response regulator NtrX